MKTRHAGMAFILVTLFLDVLGLGIIIPILPELVTSFVGGDASLGSRYYGILIAIYALMQFCFSPMLGALSDRFGRRPIILVALFGLGVDYLILAFAPNLTWFVVGRIIAGIAGATLTTINAYIADISTAETRARNYGLVGVSFGLGFIAGPALGGVLGEISPRLPFIGSAVLALLNWLYGYFILPESLPLENRNAFAWSKANPIGGIMHLRTYPLVAWLALVTFFSSLAQRGLESAWVLSTGVRFDWGPRDNGLALAFVGVMAAIVQGGLIQVFVKRFGERRTLLFGTFISIVSFTCYGLATQGWMMLVTIVFGAFSGLALPALQAIVASTVSPREQGVVQGALQSIISLTSIIAPILFTTWLLSYFIGDSASITLPGAPFLLGAFFFLVAYTLTRIIFRRYPESPSPANPE